jgi:hypothetical protein
MHETHGEAWQDAAERLQEQAATALRVRRALRTLLWLSFAESVGRSWKRAPAQVKLSLAFAFPFALERCTAATMPRGALGPHRKRTTLHAHRKQSARPVRLHRAAALLTHRQRLRTARRRVAPIMHSDTTPRGRRKAEAGRKPSALGRCLLRG